MLEFGERFSGPKPGTVAAEYAASQQEFRETRDYITGYE